MEVPLPGNVAVHHIGTWLFVAFHQRWEESGLVDVEQQEDKHSIHRYLKQQAKKVGPPKTPSLLPCVIVQRGTVSPVLQLMFALTFFSVGHVERHKKGRAGDKDQLQSPESGVGDGEVVVVADIVTTRLPGVAIKVLLLVTPDLLASHQEDQEPEDENDGEPDATERCGVFVHPAEEALKEGPVHGVTSDVRLDHLEEKEATNTRKCSTHSAECSNTDDSDTN